MGAGLPAANQRSACQGGCDSQAKPLALALVGAVIAAGTVWYYYTRYAPDVWSDFDQIWLGARALVRGEDPSRIVGESGFPWPLYYPTPALVLGLPFAGLSVMMARILFAATTCGLCVYAILRWRPYAWPLLCTGPFVYALQRGQWSPLLLTAGLVPAAGAVLIAKPTIGAAVFAYRPSWVAVIASAGLAVTALALDPEWPVRWIESARGTQHVLSPILLPGGWVLASVLLRWRRPEARLLGLLALMPQTTSMYELVPLALLPRTPREAVFLALAFNLLYAVTWTLYGRPFTPADLHSNYIPASWVPMLTLGYLPALWLVLRPFPLWSRSQESVVRGRWSQRAYVAIWILVLGLIVCWVVAGGWFIWRYVLPRFLWH